MRRTLAYLLAALTFILADALCLAVVQPISVMTMSLEEMYSTGQVTEISGVALAIAIVASIGLVVGFLPAFHRVMAAAAPPSPWSILNFAGVLVALVLAVFGVASVVLGFAFLGLEDVFRPIAHGPFWMMLINVLLPIPILILVLFSHVFRRQSASLRLE